MAKGDFMEQEDPMTALCRMVVNTNYEDLPSSVVKYAKYSILDTLAIIIGGSGMDGVSAVVDLVKDKGGKPESIIPFYGGKVPASEAALAIGPMARAMDYGEVHEAAGHIAEYTFPALLAATGLKNKITGKEFITAYILGQEVSVRIGIAFQRETRGVPIGRGSGHTIFGCVAAIGKLLGLSFEELQNAEGIAAEMTQPHSLAMYKPGSLIVRVHHGFVCQDAINACLLARKGITGPLEEVLLGPRGYLKFATWETQPEAILKNLGDEWEMQYTMMKPYNACKCTHTAAAGIIDMMEEHRFAPEDIESVHTDQSSINWTILSEPKEVKWNPRTVPECQFSLPYVMATAAFDGEVTPSSYTEEARNRKDVRGLMAKITASHDPSLPTFGARVGVILRDGRHFRKDYPIVKGHPKDPFSEQDLLNKLNMCVPCSFYKLSADVVDSLTKAVLDLENVDDVVSAMLLPLTPQEEAGHHQPIGPLKAAS
jgi:2-methylcitrate dehydratase PrpD